LTAPTISATFHEYPGGGLAPKSMGWRYAIEALSRRGVDADEALLMLANARRQAGEMRETR
jgi:hypothetical protein